LTHFFKRICKKKYPKIPKNDRESFIRWQEYRISHLSFSINLFLGLAVASIAFLISQDDSYHLTSKTNIEALFWWFLSALFGMFATISRLVNFRYTAKRILSRHKKYFCLTNIAGHITWICFGCGLLSYCLGVLYFIVLYVN